MFDIFDVSPEFSAFAHNKYAAALTMTPFHNIPTQESGVMAEKELFTIQIIPEKIVVIRYAMQNTSISS